MVTLDLEVRALLAAIRHLDKDTRDPLDEQERSMALAFLGGVMRSMLEHGVEPRHATPTIVGWVPTGERAAEKTKDDGSLNPPPPGNATAAGMSRGVTCGR